MDGHLPRVPRPRAVLLDFNGTLSLDEHLLYEVCAEIFRELGHALTEDDYRLRLAGLSDVAMAAEMLGRAHPATSDFIRERLRRYRARVSDGATIGPDARAAVRILAATMPVGIVSAAFRAEIEDVLHGAGISGSVSFVVSVDDVARAKPDPEAYLLALRQLGGMDASRVVAVEDTPAGIAAATGAGIACVAVRGTVGDERLAGAMATVERLDAALAHRILDGFA